MSSAGIVSDFLQCEKTTGANYLKQVSTAVSKHRQNIVPLKVPSPFKWKIGGLADTIYKGNKAEVKEWGSFYLSKKVELEVIGAVEDFHCQSGQLVMVACEDKQVYAFDGEELHLVARSLKELCEQGLQYPGLKSFYRGECFKDMTEHDWAAVRQGSVGKKLDRDHQALVRNVKPTFMECLDVIQQARQTAAEPLPFQKQMPKIHVP
ncbi:uncharacterized protein ACJ7VT_000282 [Polymixia lowei]